MSLKKISALLAFLITTVLIIYLSKSSYDPESSNATMGTKLTQKEAIKKIITREKGDDKQSGYSFGIKRAVTDSGIKIWYKYEKNSPVISMNFFIKNAGGISVDKELLGLDSIASAMLTKGLPGKSFEDIENDLSRLNMSISFSTDIDHFYGSSVFLHENKDDAIQYINAFLTKATFPKEQLYLTKKSTILGIESREKSPSFRVKKELFSILYRNHFYGKIKYKESAQSITKISQNDLVNYIRNNFNKSNLHVSIVSPMDRDEVIEFVESCFKDLPVYNSNKSSNIYNDSDNSDSDNSDSIYDHPAKQENTFKIKTLPFAQPKLRENEINIKANNNQSSVIFFISEIVDTPREAIKLSILSTILDKKLYDLVRAKYGLTYSIGTGVIENQYSNIAFIGYTNVDIKNRVKAFTEIRKALDNISKNGVEKFEFMQARNRFINIMYQNLTSNPRISSLMMNLATNDRDHNYLDKRESLAYSITVDEFNDFIRKNIDTSKLFFVYSMPEQD